MTNNGPMGKPLTERPSLSNIIVSEGKLTVAKSSFKGNEKYIWDKLNEKIKVPCGTAALMGNLFAESNFDPHILEYSFQKKMGFSCDGYTEAVDRGEYQDFSSDKAGYGIAQWTLERRKQKLLSFAKSKGTSIGDLDMQLEFLWKELCEDYPQVHKALISANDVKTASDIILAEFEDPYDQSERVRAVRAGAGQEFYSLYALQPSPGDVIVDMKDNSAFEEHIQRLLKWRQDVSLILADSSGGDILYERDADRIRPVGSVTKLMAFYCIMQMIGTDKEKLRELVVIDKEAQALSHDPRYSAHEQMGEGEEYTVDQLLFMMLTASSCAASVALSKHFFGSIPETSRIMNETATKLGLSGSFVSPTGIEPENRCSARDLVILARALIWDCPLVLRYTSCNYFMFRGILYRTTNSLMRKGYVLGMDGLKSGTSDEGGCTFVGSAKRGERRLISVVLNTQDDKERVDSTAALLEYGFWLLGRDKT